MTRLFALAFILAFFSFAVFAAAPTQSPPVLNSSSGKNLNTDNFTAWNQSTHDADGNTVINIYNWRFNGVPYAVLNMPFETNSSTVAKDYSGYGNNGTVNGATWNSSGKIGGAYIFDGVNDYISVPASDSLAINTRTIEMWFKPNVTYSGAACSGYDEIALMARWNSTMGDGLNTTMVGWLDDGSQCLFGIFANDPDGDYWITTSDTLNAGTWYHVAAVLDSSNGEAKLYLNGVLKNTSDYGTPPNTDRPYSIGASEATDQVRDFFNGSIDEVRIYDRVLSQEQIAAHHDLEYNKIVSQELSVDDVLSCQITPNDNTASGDGVTLSSNDLTVGWGGNLQALLNISHTCSCGTNVSTTGISFGSLTAGQVSGIQSLNFTNLGSGPTTDTTIEGTTWNASLTQGFGENYTKWSTNNAFNYADGTSVTPAGSTMSFNLENNESKQLYFRVQVPLGTTRGAYDQTLTLTTIC